MRVLNYAFLIVALAAAALLVFRPPLFAGEPGGRKLSADLMPGAVALPHGWGHQAATGLSVASKTRGVNANLLAADGPDAIEPLSGMAQFNGIAVRISAVAAATATRAAS